jgi:phosphate starvation-inducible PhoH-like protein
MKKDGFITKKLSLLYTPKTANQKIYVNALNTKEDYILAVTGPAGTGKTLLACTSAIESFKQNKIDKIILTRPVVPVEEDIGFLPGTMVKKMDPWTRPIFDIFEEYYSKAEVINMVNNGQIEISPLGFMRGRTFKNAFIIADEMQNSSPNQMLMLLTRIGKNSRMVITGDLAQSDKLHYNGLKDLIEKYKIYNVNGDNKLSNINLIELNNTDVQRSHAVEEVLKLYNYNPVVKPLENPVVKPEVKPAEITINDEVKNNKETKTELKPKTILKKPKYLNPDDFDAALIPRAHYKNI